MNSIARKAVLIGATTAVGITMFASAALAATTAPAVPAVTVLSTIPAGMTTYPGMEGDCASCHTYEPVAPGPAPIVP